MWAQFRYSDTCQIWKLIKESNIYFCNIDNIFNTFNGRHFPEDIFKRIFLNEDIWLLIKFSLDFVPSDPIYNIPVLV